ncbi:MAG: helix-turn-helix domain-containing protein [Evtepia sp.]
MREARTRAGLSQEQLARKLRVSRSAVAKWETGKGLPDVENLKALSQLLHVTIDQLLDDSESTFDDLVMREPYTLSAYGKGSKKAKKDRAVRERFPDAEIHTLLGRQKLTKAERIIDNAVGILTDAPFGIPDLMNDVKNLEKEFYLVEREGTQLLVTVTDAWIETRPLDGRFSQKKLALGPWVFTKCAYPVK